MFFKERKRFNEYANDLISPSCIPKGGRKSLNNFLKELYKQSRNFPTESGSGEVAVCKSTQDFFACYRLDGFGDTASAYYLLYLLIEYSEEGFARFFTAAMELCPEYDAYMVSEELGKILSGEAACAVKFGCRLLDGLERGQEELFLNIIDRVIARNLNYLKSVLQTFDAERHTHYADDYRRRVKLIGEEIRRWDPYDLFATDCPQDEFDSEIFEIASKTANRLRLDELVCVISDVFVRAFNDELNFSAEKCRQPAINIYARLYGIDRRGADREN